MQTLAKKWYEEGKEIGLKEGIYEDKKEVAMNMLNMGMKIDVIVKATGLSKKEVEEIKKLNKT